MRYFQTRHVSFALMGALLFVLTVIPVYAQTSFSYAYFKIEQDWASVELVTIDPLQSDLPAKTQTYPLPPGWQLSSPRFRSLVSPNGEWIASALTSTDNTRLMIYLYNVVSGEARQITEGYILMQGRNFGWSPDSLYLALVIGKYTEDLELLVYSIADSSLTNITNDDFDQHDLGWSPDSKQILTFTHPCSINDPCSHQLEVFDREKAAPLAQIDLTSLPFVGGSACDPRVSPDGSFISLISNCGLAIGFVIDFPNEGYVWNVETEELSQITDFANGAKAGVFRSYYQQVWLDAQTLLIGVNYAVGDTPEQQRLVTYNPVDKTTNLLSNEFGFGFALNNAKTQLSLESSNMFTEETNAGRQTQLGILPVNQESSLQDQISDLSAINSLDIPTACEMQWSPDGNILAIPASDKHCTSILSSVFFVNAEDNLLEEYRTELNAADQEEGSIVPIGWIQG
jgi:hypothetical protein